MKKRILSLITSLSILGTCTFTAALPASAAPVSTPEFYRFDFNNSLEATTDGGGKANKLIAPESANHTFTEDGKISFECITDKTAASNGGYSLETPIELKHNKSWLVEWKGNNITPQNQGHETIFMTTQNIANPWFLINRNDGQIRIEGGNVLTKKHVDTNGNMKTNDTNTYMFKNIPDADGNGHVYFSINGQPFEDLTYAEGYENYFADRDMSVLRLFGGGYNATWDYAGAMDYFEVYTDLSYDTVTEIADSKLNVTEGDGTAMNPYTAAVSLPYSCSSVSAADIKGAYKDLKLYEDDTYATEVSTIDTAAVTKKAICFSADGVYYTVNALFEVDLSKDSGLYKFDFNGTLATSEGGLENELVPTGVSEDHPISYINDNTELNVASEVAGSDGTVTGNLNGASNPTVIYPLAKDIVLNSAKSWKISARLRTRFKNGILLAESQNENFQIWDWYPQNSETGMGRSRFVTQNIANAYWTLNIENTYNAETASSSMAGSVKSENGSVVSQATPFDTTGKTRTLKYMFSTGAIWGFGGYVDYIYIDTDADKTAAMEFLAKYDDVIRTDPTQVSDEKAEELLNAYTALSDNAKAYLVRGENELIKTITSRFLGKVEKLAGNGITINGGSGTKEDPYTASVTIPYTLSSITSGVFTGKMQSFALYTDAGFTEVTESIAVSTSYEQTIYCAADGIYYVINGTYAADLDYDSAAYKFNFNSSLETNGSLYNRLIPTDGCEYTFTDDSIKLEKRDVIQFFNVENPITLPHDKAWTLTWRGAKEYQTGDDSTSTVFMKSENDTKSPHAVLHSYELRWNYGTTGKLGTMLGALDSLAGRTFIIKNTPSDGKANITLNYNGTDTPLTWDGGTNNNADISPETDVTIGTLLGGGLYGSAKFNYKGTMDYFYIDLDPDKTAAMEFLADYGDILMSGEFSDVPVYKLKKMAKTYENLSDASKAYFVRGENEAAKNIPGYIDMYLKDGKLYVTTTKAQSEKAKLLICEYTDDTLVKAEINDVLTDSEKPYEYTVGEYTSDNVKAILIDDFDSMVPLSQVVTIK